MASTSAPPNLPNDSAGTGRALSASERRRILRERAARLARTQEEEDAGAEETDVVLFTLGQTPFAIECRHVLETYSSREITPLATAPQHIRGIINFRGQIVPVIELDGILALDHEPIHSDRLLVIDSPVGPVALQINDILDVQRVADEESEIVESGNVYFVNGRTHGGISILDIQHLIAATRLQGAPEEQEEETEL